MVLVGELTCTRMALSSLDSCALKTLSRCGVVWRGVVRCGVVWCGVVWRGVVWCGVVWCGVAVRSNALVVWEVVGLSATAEPMGIHCGGGGGGGGTATQSHVNIGWNKESI